MALNIKNTEVERLAKEIADLTGESKTQAIRLALLERRRRIGYRFAAPDRASRARRFLEAEVWPKLPAAQRGRRLTRDEEDAVLGYGPEGV